jgi:hypothetical protein
MFERSEIMSTWPIRICAAMVALLAAGIVAAQNKPGTGDQVITTSPISATSPGQVRVADKFAAPFVTLAGSRENAVALATALRNGSAATLTYTAIAADGTPVTTTVLIEPPTKPMGWGNVSHSLALAQFALNQAGISNPTGAQLKVALEGGSFTTADGKTITLAGVLQQRADGMGFGRIAQSYGTTMGAVNRGIKAPATTVATATVVPKTPSNVTTNKVASAPGAAEARGLTTAAGTPAGTGQGAKGLTTANGATSRASSNGIVSASGSAHGNGNAYGRGVVTASGSSANAASGMSAGRGVSSGIVTGAGNAGHVVNADHGQGAGSGNGQGKGKGG